MRVWRGVQALTPDRMQQLTTSPEMATPEERDAFLDCLGHDAELRLLLTQVLTTTGPAECRVVRVPARQLRGR